MNPDNFAPTITVCSDASVSYEYPVAAWACYIRTPETTIKTSGVLKEYTKSSSDAELQGLSNALYILDKSKDLSAYRLIIYCDNTDALGDIAVSKRRKTTKGHMRKEFFETNILTILKKAKSYETRHVKAHVHKSEWHATSSRNYMNDWCDREARSVMRLRVKELAKESEYADNL